MAVNVLKTNSTINIMILLFLFVHKLSMTTTQSPFNKLQNMGKIYQEKNHQFRLCTLVKSKMDLKIKYYFTKQYIDLYNYYNGQFGI